MKAKKLTKREWYLAADWWEGEKEGRNPLNISSRLISSSWMESFLSVGEYQEDIDSDYDNRLCFYVQYCLERAGIPAGEP